MSRIPKTPTGIVRVRRTERFIEEDRKRGPGIWVYVGTFPTDLYTSYWSPPWQNSFTYVTGRRVAFRHGIDGVLEFKGKIDTTAAATATVAFTLPSDWIPPDELDFLVTLDTGGGTFNALRLVVSATTGTVTAYWPVT